jgi:hypothetical protein
MMITRDRRGQAAASSFLLVMLLTLLAGAVVDVYRLQTARTYAYRAAEAAALSGVAAGRDLSTVYSAGQARVDPSAGYDGAEETLTQALNRRGMTGASYQIEVLEWGGTVNNYPPVARADLLSGASDWTSSEPAVGVYLAMPVETFVLGLATSNAPVTVHVFAAAGIHGL